MTRPSEAEVTEALAMMLYTADRPSQLGELAALVGVEFTMMDQYRSALRIAAALSTPPLPSAEPRDLSGYCVACGQEAGPHNTYGDAEGRHALNVYPNFSVCDSCLPSSDDTAPLTNEMEPEEAALRCWHNDFTNRCIPFEEIAEQLMRWTALRTTPPAAAQDTGRMDWLQSEENRSGRIASLVVKVNHDRNGSEWANIHGDVRAAIDNAMDAARAAGGE